jgi:hypothetical protein
MCPKNPEACEQEARIQETIIAIKNKQHTTHTAAIAFNVPRCTLYRRIKENTNHATLPMNVTKFSPMPKRVGTMDYSHHYHRLPYLLQDTQRNDRGNMQLIERSYRQRLVRLRHREIASFRTRSSDAVLVKDTSPDGLQQWFADLSVLIQTAPPGRSHSFTPIFMVQLLPLPWAILVR